MAAAAAAAVVVATTVLQALLEQHDSYESWVQCSGLTRNFACSGCKVQRRSSPSFLCSYRLLGESTSSLQACVAGALLSCFCCDGGGSGIGGGIGGGGGGGGIRSQLLSGSGGGGVGVYGGCDTHQALRRL